RALIAVRGTHLLLGALPEQIADQRQIRAGGMAALEVGERRGGFRALLVLVLGDADLQLGLFAVFAERILVEAVAVVFDGLVVRTLAQVRRSELEILVGAARLLGGAAGGGEQSENEGKPAMHCRSLWRKRCSPAKVVITDHRRSG